MEMHCRNLLPELVHLDIVFSGFCFSCLIAMVRAISVSDSPPTKKIRRLGEEPDTESNRPGSSTDRPETASSVAESQQVPDPPEERVASITESQLPEEYWLGDQHPQECGCHCCHLLYGNKEWDNAGYLEELREMWRLEDEEKRLSLGEANSAQSSSSSADHIILSDSSK